jgi:hypothetical protein
VVVVFFSATRVMLENRGDSRSLRQVGRSKKSKKRANVR